MTEASSDRDRAGQDPIRVFLLDDHEVMRCGLRTLLTAEPDIRVIGEAGTAASALDQVSALVPDVAVLDAGLPDGDGIAVCREIRSTLPATACLIFTSHGDDQALFGAIVAGAAGYVLKHSSGSDLVSAVRTAAAGQSTFDGRATQLVMERLRQPMASVDPVASLTGQEKRVLDLIGAGLTNRLIAEHMALSEKTVKNYVAALLTKLGMHRRTQAAAFIARQSEGQSY